MTDAWVDNAERGWAVFFWGPGCGHAAANFYRYVHMETVNTSAQPMNFAGVASSAGGGLKPALREIQVRRASGRIRLERRERDGVGVQASGGGGMGCVEVMGRVRKGQTGWEAVLWGEGGS